MKTKLMAVVMMLAAAPVLAAGVDVRAGNLQRRINQGVRSGELTPRETVRLEAREGHLQREIARDRADGSLNLRERARINRQENRLSRGVFVQKHDGQAR